MAAKISILILALLPIIKAAPQGLCDGGNFPALRTRGSCNIAPPTCQMFDTQPYTQYTPYSDITQLRSTSCDVMPPPNLVDPSTVVYTSLTGGCDSSGYDGGFPPGFLASIGRQQSGSDGLRSRGTTTFNVSPQQYSLFETQSYPLFSPYTDYRPQQPFPNNVDSSVIYTQDISGPDFNPGSTGGGCGGGGCVGGGCVGGGCVGGGCMSGGGGLVMPGPGYDISYTSSISPPSINGYGGLIMSNPGCGYSYGIPSTGMGLQANVGMGPLSYQ